MTIHNYKQKVKTILFILIVAITILPIAVSAETIGIKNGTSSLPYTFSISNNIIGDPDDKDSHEFSFTGKIQGGFFRNAVPGDYWYGTSDIVYEGLTIYRDSFEFKKKRTSDGSLMEEGTITPNWYGFFSFTLKHDETIEFSVKNIGKMNFYLYQTPDNEYTTKAVLDNIIFAETVNVKTGEVIGVGGIPGGMETRYYEENQDNFSTEYAPRLQSLTGDAKIDYYNTSTLIKKTYAVSYKFLSKDGEKQLPQEVLDLLPAGKAGVKDGTRVVFTMPEKTEVKVDGGRWIFEGYAFSEVVVSGEDVVAEGIWIFEEDEIHETFEVSYIFTCTTQGKEIPEEVIALMPKEIDVENGTMVTALMPEKKQIAVEGEKWIFVGYTFDNAIVRGEDILFVGEWKYVADAVPPKETSEGTIETTPKMGRSTQIGNEDSRTHSTDPNEGGDNTEDVKKDVNNKEVSAVVIESTEKPWHRLIRRRYAPLAVAIMGIFEVFLYTSIMSDVRVLRWYHQKKKINMVIK